MTDYVEWQRVDPLSPHRFINRELSWLAFNQRVLAQAASNRHPLLERVRFLSISDHNLDEFYMVRVAGLKSQIANNHSKRTPDGCSPVEQLEDIADTVKDIRLLQHQLYHRLVKTLAKNGLHVVDPQLLEDKHQQWLANYFKQKILPVLSPLAIEQGQPFPFMPNLASALLVRSRDALQHSRLTLVPLPSNLPRLIAVESATQTWVRLEHVVKMFLTDLLPHQFIMAKGTFRVIRDSEIALADDSADLVSSFITALQQRRRGNVIHLQMSRSLPRDLQLKLINEYQMLSTDVLVTNAMLGMGDLSQLVSQGPASMKYIPLQSRFPERIHDYKGSCLAAIKQKDIIVHHPYESFDVVADFLQQAAADPDVLAIKQTLYRTTRDSPILKALVTAAENGKAVTALIELKARFDEAANIEISRELERVGAQVVHGFTQLKTHAKMSLVVRREADGRIQNYAHFGTGNYHPINAKVYTDLSFFTCDAALCDEAQHIFNYLTANVVPTHLQHIAIAPLYLRGKLKQLIATEIAHAKAKRGGYIWAKMNSLVDPEMIDLLYEASHAGVQIDLVVRGICCLRPGIVGLSENIRVKSLIGRFLEHARIFAFGDGQALPSRQAKVFISSADWMPRNLDHRVETMIPIYNPTVHQQVLDQIMLANMLDTDNSYALQPNGTYRAQRVQRAVKIFNAHQYFAANPSLSGRGQASVQGRLPPALKLGHNDDEEHL